MATYRLDLALERDAPFGTVEQLPVVEAATLDEAFPRLAKTAPLTTATPFWARAILSVRSNGAPGRICLVYVKNQRAWEESTAQALRDSLLLHSGDKQVMIEGTPLASQATWFVPSQIIERHVELTQPTPDRMELTPRRSYLGILGVLSILWIAAIVPFFFVELPGGIGTLGLFAAFFAVPFFVLLWHKLGLTSWSFSTGDQLLIRRSIGRIRYYSLRDVIAVQVCGGDRCLSWRHEALDGHYWYRDLSPTYQLNLVFKAAPVRRLHLTQQPELGWARDSGQRLAALLGVSCVVQGCAEGATASSC